MGFHSCYFGFTKYGRPGIDRFEEKALFATEGVETYSESRANGARKVERLFGFTKYGIPRDYLNSDMSSLWADSRSIV